MRRSITEHESEALLATLAGLYIGQGKAREVAILAYSHARFEVVGYDNFDGGINIHMVTIVIPLHLYSQVVEQQEQVEQDFTNDLNYLLKAQPGAWITGVRIVPEITPRNDNWREQAQAWVRGDGINNQGRVRSENVAPLTCHGLLFRSQPEINLYLALKATGISFAPLPVFVRGGTTYRRIEPDFVIYQGRELMVVEVDGDTVHTETPAEAHDRTTMLDHEGAHIERVRASECDTPEKALKTAKRLLELLRKHQANR